MSNEIVSIIVVAAGRRDYLKSCLDSIKEQSYINIETIVIDNSQNNLSYCQALNKGIDMSKGEFILCLNDDASLDRAFIAEALKGFQADEGIGIVSGKILRTDKKTIDSTGLFLSIWRTAGERGYGLKDMGQFEKSGYIFGVSGAVAFYRRKMLEQIKIDSEYFDSDFRFFYEDLDLAWRAQNYGWRAYYAPGAIAYHVRGGTARQASGINKRYARRYLGNELHYELIKNRYLTVIKNESLLGFFCHLPFIAVYDILAWGYVLFFRLRVMKLFLLKKLPLKSAFRKRSL